MEAAVVEVTMGVAVEGDMDEVVEEVVMVEAAAVKGVITVMVVVEVMVVAAADTEVVVMEVVVGTTDMRMVGLATREEVVGVVLPMVEAGGISVILI